MTKTLPKYVKVHRFRNANHCGLTLYLGMNYYTLRLERGRLWRVVSAQQTNEKK